MKPSKLPNWNAVITDTDADGYRMETGYVPSLCKAKSCEPRGESVTGPTMPTFK
jgi:hypothetical protein